MESQDTSKLYDYWYDPRSDYLARSDLDKTVEYYNKTDKAWHTELRVRFLKIVNESAEKISFDEFLKIVKTK